MSLATGWLAGDLGGAERIVVGQLDGAEVKVFSSGSALDGGPSMYLHSAAAHPRAQFAEMASFAPFGPGTRGVSVAATSTTTGADLLVGTAPREDKGQIRRFAFAKPFETATSIAATQLGTTVMEEIGAFVLAGD